MRFLFMGRGGKKKEISTSSSSLHAKRKRTLGVFSTAIPPRKKEPRSAAQVQQTLEEWKEAEANFIKEVQADLARMIKEAASSSDSWRALLDNYLEVIEYSPRNVLWARSQLRYRGVEEPGRILSESQWAMLGRRVKEEYACPYGKAEKKRDAKHGYDSSRAWDAKYSAEMIAPVGKSGFYKEKDNPKTGKKEKVWIPLPPKAFRTFAVYHEDATEAIDGSNPAPLPKRVEVSGPSEGAQKLIEEFSKVSARLSLDVENTTGGSRTQDGKVLLDPSDSEQKRAEVMLYATCTKAAGEEPSDPDTRVAHKTAIKSAAYVLGRLYELDMSAESFAGLGECLRLDKTKTLEGKTYGIVHSTLSMLGRGRQEQAISAGRKAKRAKQAP